jgi:hypothetical protein
VLLPVSGSANLQSVFTQNVCGEQIVAPKKEKGHDRSDSPHPAGIRRMRVIA